MSFPTGTVIVDLSGAGARGPKGSQLLKGAGSPASSLGNAGDYYFDTAARQIYGPKAAGAWGAPTSLVEPETVIVADNIADVQAVAGGITAVTAVAADLANVNYVGASITNVGLVAGSIANVDTVAGFILAVGTVAGSISDVTAVATNIDAVIAAAGATANIVAALANISADIIATQQMIVDGLAFA